MTRRTPWPRGASNHRRCSDAPMRLVPLAALLAASAAGVPRAGADRMAIPLHNATLKENVRIFESGQRALISWDGEMETLILSTDVRADKPVQLLEVLPLPSKPDVSEGSF